MTLEVVARHGVRRCEKCGKTLVWVRHAGWCVDKGPPWLVECPDEYGLPTGEEHETEEVPTS